MNSIIVNGNEGSVQTTDISVETGKDVWLVVSGPEEYDVSYEEPADSPAPEEEPSTESAPSETEDEGGVSPVVIVVIVVAAVAVIAIVAVAVQKKKKSAGK